VSLSEESKIYMLYLLEISTISVQMTHVAKIIELVGGSDIGWKEAAQAAVDEAKKTVHRINGVEITNMTANVDPNTGKITQYRAIVKISFGVEH
jgi:dodecin